MISQTYSRAALRQSETQRLEYRIKEINISLIRLVAERRLLAQKRNEAIPRPAVIRREPVEKRKYTGSGRKRVFTDEVLIQIPMWVKEGLSREEIAARFGCTPNSLQATCCKKGISLRRKSRSQPAEEAV
jgi:hypothetical protein